MLFIWPGISYYMIMKLAKFDLLLTIALLIIVVTAIAMLINGQNGLSVSQKTDAVTIANTQPDLIEAYTSNDRGGHSVESITPLGTDGRSGYLNTSDQYQKVSIKFGDSWAVGENRGIVVDMDSKKVMGWEQYFRSPGRPPYFETSCHSPGRLLVSYIIWRIHYWTG